MASEVPLRPQVKRRGERGYFSCCVGDSHRNVDFRRLQKCRDVAIHEVFAEGFFRVSRGLLDLIPIFLQCVFLSIKCGALFIGTCLVSTTVVPTRHVLLTITGTMLDSIYTRAKCYKTRRAAGVLNPMCEEHPWKALLTGGRRAESLRLRVGPSRKLGVTTEVR